MAVALDTSLNQDSGGTPTLTRAFNYTCTGANLVMLVTVHTDKTIDTGGVISVQYRQQFLTKLTDITTDVERVEVWELASPATGSHQVAVTFSEICGHTVTVATYTGSDGTYGSAIVNSGSDNAPTVTTESVAGDVVADVVCVDSAVTISAGAGETIHGTPGEMTSPVTAQSVSGEQAGAASVTSLYSLSAPANWLIIAVPIHAGTQTASTPQTTMTPGGLGYTEVQTNTAITATTSGTAQHIVGVTVTYDGLSRCRVSVFFPGFAFSGGATWIRFALYRDGSEVGILTDQIKDVGPRAISRVVTPASGSKAFSCRAYVDAGTVNVEGGAAGAGVISPGYMVIEKLDTV